MSKPSAPPISRRRLLMAGAGTAGALTALTALPVARQAATPSTEEKQTHAQSGGYQLTEHVLTYYKTARV